MKQNYDSPVGILEGTSPKWLLFDKQCVREFVRALK